jgi:hypothetical protein
MSYTFWFVPTKRVGVLYLGKWGLEVRGYDGWGTWMNWGEVWMV